MSASEAAYRLDVRLPSGWTAWSRMNGPSGSTGRDEHIGPSGLDGVAPGSSMFAWVGDPPGRAAIAFATVDLVPRPAPLRSAPAAQAARAVLDELSDASRWRPADPALSVLRRQVLACSLEGACVPAREGAAPAAEPAAAGERDPAVLVDEWIAVGDGERRLVEHRVVLLRFPRAASGAGSDAVPGEPPWALRVSAVTKQLLTDPPLVAAARAIAAATRIEVVP